MTERELYNTLVDGIDRRSKAKQEAAAELARLRAENERLREALQPFAALETPASPVCGAWTASTNAP